MWSFVSAWPTSAVYQQPLWETRWLLLCYSNIRCHYNLKSSFYYVYNPVTRSPQSLLNGRAVKHGRFRTELRMRQISAEEAKQPTRCSLLIQERALQNIRENEGEIKSGSKANIHYSICRFMHSKRAFPLPHTFYIPSSGESRLELCRFGMTWGLQEYIPCIKCNHLAWGAGRRERGCWWQNRGQRGCWKEVT